jgi:hypothetical protein
MDESLAQSASFVTSFLAMKDVLLCLYFLEEPARGISALSTPSLYSTIGWYHS